MLNPKAIKFLEEAVLNIRSAQLECEDSVYYGDMDDLLHTITDIIDQAAEEAEEEKEEGSQFGMGA